MAINLNAGAITICLQFILLSLVVEATIEIANDTISDELRQPRVSGRIVKVYSGTRPEPVYCPQEGFQPDPVNCAIFYRCVKGANNKYTAFRFQCGPGTVYDPDTEVCNHPQSTRRTECGGNATPSNDKKHENEVDGIQNELPSPITNKPVYAVSTTGSSSYTTAYPWATSKPLIPQSSSSANPWMTTQDNKGFPARAPTSATQSNRQDRDPCVADGFMGDSEDCRKFYRCVGNQRGGFIRYEFSCSESTIWDDDTQSCNHPWSVQRRRCGRGNTDNTVSANEQIPTEQEAPGNTVQQQLQISYGDKVSQTQTQISHGSVIQNQTQINYNKENNKQDNSQVKQNQTQISHGSAISQTQTQISHANNGIQTQLQIDHSKEASQSQVQQYETTTKHQSLSTNPTYTNENDADAGYNNQATSQNSQDDQNGCTESGFMGDKNDCKKFYRCVDNGKGGFTKYEFSCGEGTVWDNSIEACNHAWAVKNCGGKSPQSSSQSSSASTTTQNYYTTAESLTSDDGEDVGYGNQNQNPEPISTTSQPNPVTTTTTFSIQNSDDMCKTSGFIGDSKDCKKFYRCVDNGNGSYTKYEFKCGEGTVWDSSIEACNHPWAVSQCGGSSTDINKVDSTTSSTESSFVTTVTLIQTTQSTSENIDYDSGYGQQQSQAPAASSTQSSNYSEANKCGSSGFMGDKNDCKKFYRCVDNGDGKFTRYEFSCGEGTVWDPKIEACNHAWAVEKCSSDSSGDINKEATTNPHPAMNDEEIVTQSNNEKETEQTTQYSSSPSMTTNKAPSGAECFKEGFMGDNNDCKKFYRCVDNGHGGFIKYEFSCGEGTAWDSEINACNHEDSVKTCGSTNQNAPETSSESTTDDNATTSAQSTEETKTTEKPAATSKPSSNNCTEDGFMGDNKDCKKFYRCVDIGRGGFIKYEFSCGDGTVWDQEIKACNHPSSDNSCNNSGETFSTEPYKENDETHTETASETSSSTTDSSQSTTTTQHPQNSRDQCASEGFFGNSNDCKKFYRCVDNGKGGYTKYEFDCGEGTVWDQEIQACNHESSNPNCSTKSSDGMQTSKPTAETSESSSPSEEGNQKPTKKPENQPNESNDKCSSEGFYADSKDCKKFYRCVDNGKGGFTKYDFTCGEGTMWVQEIQACDHDDGGESKCSSQSQSSSASESSQETSTASSLPESTSTQTLPQQNDEEISNETSASSSKPSSNDKCESEGFHPDSNDCRRFYRCVDNGNGGYTKYDFTCGEGTAWDADIQTCNHINEVKSCQESSSQGNNQQGSAQNDDNTQSSDSTTTSSSTSGSTTASSKPNNQDKCEQEGYYGNSQDCTKFYRCVDNGNGGLTKYDFSCGEGTIWDQDITTCNHPQDVKNPSCQQSDNSGGSNSDSSSTTTTASSSSSQESSSTTESNTGSSNCSQESNKKPESKDVNCTEAGYYPDPNDCKKFYRCVDWNGDGSKFSVYHFECGEGTIWDPALDTCNHEDSVYPPRDCSGAAQSQTENVNQESTTEESGSTTDGGMTTQESNSNEQTTQQSTDTTTTTEKTTQTEQSTTTEQPTTQSNGETTEQSTTQQSTENEQTTTSEHTTTEQTTTEQSNDTEKTTTEQTTTSEQTTTQHPTTTESMTEQTTTDQTSNEQTTSQQTTTTEESTTEGTSEHPENTEQTTSATDQNSTTEQSTTQQTSTEESSENQTQENSTSESTTTTEENDTSTSSQDNSSTTEDNQESTTESGETTTENNSSSDKECPETEDDQNLFVCPTSFRRHPKYCNMFYQCTEDDDTHDVQIATFHCPNNTIYDESKTQCVEEKKADKKCDGEIAQKRRVKRLDASHKEPIVVSNERLKCPTTGHYPFEKQECSPAFLKCEKSKSGNIRGFVYQCPKGYVYWSVSRRCEPTSYLRDCKKSYNNWDNRWEIPIERRNVAKK